MKKILNILFIVIVTLVLTGCAGLGKSKEPTKIELTSENFEEYFYIQVSYSVAEEKAENREFRVFEKIRDNYPKYLLTLDPLLQSRDGIFHKNLIEFLKDDYKL